MAALENLAPSQNLPPFFPSENSASSPLIVRLNQLLKSSPKSNFFSSPFLPGWCVLCCWGMALVAIWILDKVLKSERLTELLQLSIITVYLQITKENAFFIQSVIESNCKAH